MKITAICPHNSPTGFMLRLFHVYDILSNRYRKTVMAMMKTKLTAGFCNSNQDKKGMRTWTSSDFTTDKQTRVVRRQ